MLLVLLPLLFGLFLAADRPQLPERALASPAAVGQGDPRPSQPARPARDRLRAVVEKREGDTYPGRSAAANEAAPLPVMSPGPGRTSPRSAGPPSEPLFRTFCVFLC